MEHICAHITIGLPYNAHTYLLGPIMGQLDLRSQLYIRNFKFLWHAFRSDNNTIYTCINNALCNSNSGLGYKLAFIDTGIILPCLMILNFVLLE